jgi:uncharacterized membrane protein
MEVVKDLVTETSLGMRVVVVEIVLTMVVVCILATVLVTGVPVFWTSFLLAFGRSLVPVQRG